MLWFDELYLDKVKSEGYNLVLYERYVDDSNQGVECKEEEMDDEILMGNLKSIADSVLPGIIMETDIPGKYDDKKLPILDMKCWMKDGLLLYQHYSKPMATKLVISARSAHSDQTKRSVHIAECVRRMMNTSHKLDWDEYFVPVLTDYAERMMAAGYSQSYRKEILRNAVNIYEHKLAQDRDGVQPLNRPRGYRITERRKEKRLKKHSWGTRGGYVAPIIVPATPGGELAAAMRAVCEAEAIPGVKFKIAERGGVTLERQLKNSNPTASNECHRENCGPCAQPEGNGGSKRCHTTNICYKYTCNYQGCTAFYTGESSKNLMTRNEWHQNKYKSKKESFLFQHQQEKHDGQPANFKMEVLKSFKDCLSRQAAEGIFISKTEGEILNSKSEFHQPPIVRVRREIARGL